MLRAFLFDPTDTIQYCITTFDVQEKDEGSSDLADSSLIGLMVYSRYISVDYVIQINFLVRASEQIQGVDKQQTKKRGKAIERGKLGGNGEQSRASEKLASKQDGSGSGSGPVISKVD